MHLNLEVFATDFTRTHWSDTLPSVCTHDQYVTDTRLKSIGTAAYFLGIAIYFYFTKRSDTIVPYTGGIHGVGNVTAGWLEIFLAFLAGIVAFALLPGKKICKDCGETWRI